MSTSLQNSGCHQIFLCDVGLEVETLRVDSWGRIAKTPHPFSGMEGFDRDFAEAQLELVTPVCATSRDLYEVMTKMRRNALDLLAEKEQPEKLWNYSNPPEYPGDLKEASFTGELAGKTEYRKYLRKKYGTKLMLFSGVHYNFSFQPGVIPDESSDIVYLNLARHLYKNAFLPVLLMAASPVCERGLFEEGASGRMVSDYASIRCSEHGYWNKTLPILDFTDVASYLASVEKNISAGTICAAGEIYLPVRIKSKWRHALECMDAEGIAYIEYRMLDVNPFDPIGVSYEDLEFMHLFMIYLSFLPEEEFGEREQLCAAEDVKAAARLDPPEELIRRGIWILEDMKKYFEKESYTVHPYLDHQLEKLKNPDIRYAARIIRDFHTEKAQE